jgi:uncharacterized protein DUF1566
MILRALFLTATALLLATGLANARPTTAQKCQVAKGLAAAKKNLCLMTQTNKAIIGKTPNTAPCDTAFMKKFAAAEKSAAKAGGSCIVTGDAATIEQRVDTQEAAIAALLAGQSGGFQDNGDGTITDTTTGLMWEKKDLGTGNPLHDRDTSYTWTAGTTAADGTLFTVFLPGLNAGTGFANHTDWRIPTIAELETITDYSTQIPAIAAAFNSNCSSPCTVTTCSCTVQQSDYWSSTTEVGGSGFAWDVYTGNGSVQPGTKTSSLAARGVRGGS